ncbi:hypothetical protein D3C87_1518780 [compost metagenome]
MIRASRSETKLELIGEPAKVGLMLDRVGAKCETTTVGVLLSRVKQSCSQATVCRNTNWEMAGVNRSGKSGAILMWLKSRISWVARSMPSARSSGLSSRR